MSDPDLTVLPAESKWEETCDIHIYKGFTIPTFAYAYIKTKSKNFKANKDDIYLVSYPKTGTTWMQSIIYFIKHFDQINENIEVGELFPYLEHSKTGANVVENLKPPRLIKTHLPYSLLPESIINHGCKLVYITRNPKDVCVSYYHFACAIKETNYKGTFKQFFERFLNERPTYGPFWKHNLEFWNRGQQENVLFLFYEDLKQDPVSEIKKVVEFLDENLNEDQIKAIIEKCSFKKMKSGDPVFFRKGKNIFNVGANQGTLKRFYILTNQWDYNMNFFCDDEFIKGVAHSPCDLFIEILFIFTHRLKKPLIFCVSILRGDWRLEKQLYRRNGLPNEQLDKKSFGEFWFRI